MYSGMNRRQFLHGASGLATLSSTIPCFLSKTGLAFAGDTRRKIAPLPGLNDNRVLVVVQLAGGNDGLNTLVPHGEDAYRRARSKLGLDGKQTHRITDRLGLHPEMVEMKELFDDGQLAIVQNVGYPNPNRSHFRAMDIWETASGAERIWQTGWIARYFHHECAGARTPMLGLQIGERPARTFAATRSRAVTLGNPALLDWSARGAQTEGILQVNRPAPTTIEALDFVQRTAHETLSGSRQLQEGLRRVQNTVDYLPFAFSQSLKLVAQVIAAEVPTRVFYVSLGGFDTHAAQTNRHAGLLQELSQGVSTFYRDLKNLGHLDRTVLMTFSEFGRTVAENRSGGTDHGTANVMFLLGGTIRPGLHGPNLDFTKRDESGDPIAQVDFRSVYGAILAGWFNADAARILEGKFQAAPILR